MVFVPSGFHQTEYTYGIEKNHHHSDRWPLTDRYWRVT